MRKQSATNKILFPEKRGWQHQSPPPPPGPLGLQHQYVGFQIEDHLFVADFHTEAPDLIVFRENDNLLRLH